GRAGDYLAGAGSQPQRPALVHALALAGHEVDDLVGALRVELAGVRARKARRVPRELDYRRLHAQADAEVRQVPLTRVPRRGEHTLRSAQAEAPGDDDAVPVREQALAFGLFELLGVYPGYLSARVLGPGSVAQGLGHGEIGVVQPHVLAHEADAHAAARAVHPLHHLAPLGQIRLRRLETEAPADCAGQSRLLQPQRGLVEVRQGDVRYDAVLRDVAEIRHLAENAPVLNGLVAAQDDDVRRDAQALELLYRVLGGLRLVLARGAQVGHERDVDEKRVPPPGLAAYLANGFYEGLALDIAYGAADLGYEHVRSRARGQGADAALYLVRDVRYGLHSAAQVLAAALLLYDAGVDPARREVRQAIELLVYEALVVAEVEVG